MANWERELGKGWQLGKGLQLGKGIGEEAGNGVKGIVIIKQLICQYQRIFTILLPAS